MYPHSDAIKLLPNSEDQALQTTVSGDYWLVPESGLMISVALKDLLLRVLGLPPGPLPSGHSTFRCSCSVHEGPRTPVCVSPQISPNPAGKVRKAHFTYLEESLRRPCQAQKLPPTLMGSPGWRPHQPHYSQRNGPVVKLTGKKT